MLDEYFRIGIDTSTGTGTLVSLPNLLPGFCPLAEALPMFLLHLASDTDWSEEQPCFTSVAQHLAALHCAVLLVHSTRQNVHTPGKPLDTVTASLVANTLLPAIQQFVLLPGPCAHDGTINQVAELEKLYRIFERC